MQQEKIERLQRQGSKEFSPTKERNSERAVIESIEKTKTVLDDTIGDLNAKLHEHFQLKEQTLLQQYRNNLVEAQKELNELKSTTNEAQIKNKMLERKKDLERERYQLIQTNIFFSSKCEQYKKKMADLVAEGKQLQRQLVFLDAQILSTTKRKFQALNSQQQQQDVLLPPSTSKEYTAPPSSLPLLSQRKLIGSSRKLINSISVKSTNKRVMVEEGLHSRVHRTLVKGGDLPKSVMEKTPLEELFEGIVGEIKQRRKGKRSIQSLRGQQFSDYEKRAIMEEFLSKEQVKKKIYNIIFEGEEHRSNSFAMQPESKIKISYDDIV